MINTFFPVDPDRPPMLQEKVIKNSPVVGMTKSSRRQESFLTVSPLSGLKEGGASGGDVIKNLLRRTQSTLNNLADQIAEDDAHLIEKEGVEE